MAPRFYTRRTRTRIRFAHPGLLFHFMHWQLWTWAPSLFLFLIGCFPVQVKFAFIIGQVISLIADLLDLFADLYTQSAGFLDSRTMANLKTAGFVGTAGIVEGALAYYISAWSREGFAWAPSALSLLCTLFSILSLQILSSVIIKCLENIRPAARKPILLWSMLALVQLGITYFGSRYSAVALDMLRAGLFSSSFLG